MLRVVGCNHADWCCCHCCCWPCLGCCLLQHHLQALGHTQLLLLLCACAGNTCQRPTQMKGTHIVACHARRLKFSAHAAGQPVIPQLQQRGREQLVCVVGWHINASQFLERTWCAFVGHSRCFASCCVASTCLFMPACLQHQHSPSYCCCCHKCCVAARTPIRQPKSRATQVCRRLTSESSKLSACETLNERCRDARLNVDAVKFSLRRSRAA